jgi:hypothetical protein
VEYVHEAVWEGEWGTGDRFGPHRRTGGGESAGRRRGAAVADVAR